MGSGVLAMCGPCHFPVGATKFAFLSCRMSPLQAQFSGGGALPRDIDNPHVLSSSGTLQLEPKKPSDRTWQRKKSSAGHQLLANVTTKTSKKMVQTLQDMIEASGKIGIQEARVAHAHSR